MTISDRFDLQKYIYPVFLTRCEGLLNRIYSEVTLYLLYISQRNSRNI